MATKKKYKVIGSFYYHGPDGKDPLSVIIAPGEEVPELDSNEREKFLIQQKIAELSSTDGTVIKYKNLEDLTDGQIRSLLTKSHNLVHGQLKTRYFSNDTLSRIYSEAEKMKLPDNIKKLIEDKIEGILI